ncbi:MAG: pseudouridine-5'-phosphate glycosidase [Acidimicrobiales bacterium]|nr:pseudouridine-5'-phosphate glycosidase [Acidimicrobiales bacterium]
MRSSGTTSSAARLSSSSGYSPRRPSRGSRPSLITLGPRVSGALLEGRPVVALESTIFSNLGLPPPANIEAHDRCRQAVIAGGAEPALTAVLEGKATVGVEADRVATICGPARKVGQRDLAVAIRQRWAYGATTVSASLALAAAAELQVFATGGIGGVHRDAHRSFDVSADLNAIASYKVITVSSGAKVFLDLSRTLEYLETHSVPVLGFRCDEFPAFYSRSAGLPVPHRVESAAEVAAIAREHWSLGGGGILLVNPVPEAYAVEMSILESAVDRALARAEGTVGAAITPIVLSEIASLTDGQSIASNVALAESNAAVAAEVATALRAERR